MDSDPANIEEADLNRANPEGQFASIEETDDVVYFNDMNENGGVPQNIASIEDITDPDEIAAMLAMAERSYSEEELASFDEMRSQDEENSPAITEFLESSGGYPQSYAKGYEITGIDTCGKLVFQAGTALKDGKLVTSGGRVLCVYDEADTLDEAIDGAYEGVAKISFKDMHFRHDIGRTLG